MSNNLSLELKSRKDKNGATYFVGKLEAPINIDCSEGVVFLIYVSENGSEELQIAKMSKSKDENAF
jgi:hypothetical protein